ncbi:hypothetical protein [Sulfuriroseicoccus oceanibius]|uniref:Uncharacterized protein n=1 Tax=Sulfuriroseicoccus oceanibius TaxID=2707525 RepID=A0A6B3LD37_9BACT|nr:hypothetical protein [Sulfuriroseicoccus oceanibius]QQL44756.1 hypothetical protein G3M56_012880 [Sulfuriroseicoccus oceanibius]
MLIRDLSAPSIRKPLIALLVAASSFSAGYAQSANSDAEAANTGEAPALPPVAGADEVNALEKAATAHPAAATLTRYLQATLSNNPREAVALIDATSLGAFQFRTINAVRTRIDTAPNDEAKEKLTTRVLQELGFDSIEAMESAEPALFYATVQEARAKADLDNQQLPIDSVEVTILGLGGENDGRTVHFIARTKHREEVMTVSAIRVTSLVKAGSQWRISLQAQQPRLEPILEQGQDATTPEAPAPELESQTEDTPAVDPELERMRKLLEESEG